jgi:hypothetical protein
MKYFVSLSFSCEKMLSYFASFFRKLVDLLGDLIVLGILDKRSKLLGLYTRSKCTSFHATFRKAFQFK